MYVVPKGVEIAASEDHIGKAGWNRRESNPRSDQDQRCSLIIRSSAPGEPGPSLNFAPRRGAHIERRERTSPAKGDEAHSEACLLMRTTPKGVALYERWRHITRCARFLRACGAIRFKAKQAFVTYLQGGETGRGATVEPRDTAF